MLRPSFSAIQAWNNSCPRDLQRTSDFAIRTWRLFVGDADRSPDAADRYSDDDEDTSSTDQELGSDNAPVGRSANFIIT